MLIYLVLSPPHETHATIYHRIMKRYRDDGLEAAVRYGCDLFGCQPAYCKAILKSLPPPLRVGIEKARTVARGGQESDKNKQNAPPPELRSRTGDNNLKKNVPPKSCWMTWMEHAQAVPKNFFGHSLILSPNYADHAAWQADWQASRAQEFALLGSKDETSGNQSCTASVGCTGAITLRLRLPDALAGQNHDSRYLGLSGISFAYGQEPLFRALAGRQAISYRFVRDVKGWRVFASFDVAAPAQASNRHLGALGVDMNANHLAISETDRFGNLVATQKIPSVTYGKNSEQRRATLGEAAKVVATWAERVGKPVVLEELDFSKKKSEFERTGVRKARMLSAMSFLAGRASIEAACFRRGVEIIGKNPAYTSVIGRLITLAVGVYRFIRGQHLRLPVEDCRSKKSQPCPSASCRLVTAVMSPSSYP